MIAPHTEAACQAISALDAKGLAGVLEGLIAAEAALCPVATAERIGGPESAASRVLCTVLHDVHRQLDATYYAARDLALSSEEPEEIQTAAETALRYLGTFWTEDLSEVASLSAQFASRLQKACAATGRKVVS